MTEPATVCRSCGIAIPPGTVYCSAIYAHVCRSRVAAIARIDAASASYDAVPPAQTVAMAETVANNGHGVERSDIGFDPPSRSVIAVGSDAESQVCCETCGELVWTIPAGIAIQHRGRTFCNAHRPPGLPNVGGFVLAAADTGANNGAGVSRLVPRVPTGKPLGSITAERAAELRAERLVPRVASVPVLPVDAAYEARVDAMLAERAAPVAKVTPSVPTMVRELETVGMLHMVDAAPALEPVTSLGPLVEPCGHVYVLGASRCRLCGFDSPAESELRTAVRDREAKELAALAELDEARTEIARLEALCRSRDDELFAEQEQCRAARAEADALRQRVAELDLMLDERVQSMVRERDDARDALRQQVAALEQALAEERVHAAEQYQEHVAELARVSRDLAEARQSADDLARQLDGAVADAEELKRELADANRLAEERLAQLEAMHAGNLALRKRHGARDNETMFAFLDRVAGSGWHAVGDGAFASPFGTIRACHACGCLVAGGPTACGRCVAATVRKDGGDGDQ